MEPDVSAHPPTLTNRLLQPLEAAGFAAVAGLTRALPIDQASSLSGAAWRRLAPLNRRHARAEAQLAMSMPELSAAERANILDGMWDNLGRTAAEAFHIDEMLDDPTRIENDPAFEAIVARIKVEGCVFVTLHLGNWELCAPLANRAGVTVAGVYQRIRNPHVEAAVIQLRQRHFRGGLFAKSQEAGRGIIRALKQKATIGLLGDLRDFRGESVMFFGRPAPSNIFPAMLARHQDVPLYTMVVIRTEGARFKVKMIEQPPIRTADKHADVSAMTRLIQAQFETWIREYPAQWMWGHRRWG